ncbi:MAG: hypothetical protein IKL84_07265 [Clostridia bacterium]|nr:hypothetical protein [Clostridia bacterium]
MTTKQVTTTAGILTGLVIAGAAAVAVRQSPQMRVRRMTRRAGRTMEAVGTMLQSMAVMTR